MKKLITLSLSLLTFVGITKAQTFSDDFESYTAGAHLGSSSPNWTVWSGAAGEGGTTDPLIATTDNHTTGGSKSIYFTSTSATGGPNDCVLPFGGTVLNTGMFNFTAWFMIPSTKDGYFNFQGTATIGGTWSLDCYMNADGSLVVSNSGTNRVVTTHPVGTWFQLSIDANLSTNTWNLLVDGISQGTWANTVDAVYAIDIYPPDASASFWMDDVSYNIIPYTLSSVNGAVTNVTVGNGLVSQSRTSAVTVRNLGTTPITSFDITIDQNGTPNVQNITGVNIASLATYTVTATAPATLAVGLNTYSATISNVNGAGADADPSDDTKSFTLTPTTPAAGRVVFVEEGTGTWCQWCPRGAVYMDMMKSKYNGFFAGAAVHNGTSDPMTVHTYDSALAFTSFPSAKVDRGVTMDPSAIEAPFLTRVQVTADAFIVNGATYNSSTRVLKVSCTYTIQNAIAGNFKAACVITEDSVHGTASGYNQSNAYSGGASGVMGGFEVLGNPVPAAQMHYNHVARAITPDFNGIPNAFGTSAAAGTVVTYNFTYTLPAGWNSNKINIIGLFINPTGTVNNAGEATLTEAIANGFVTGTDVSTAGVAQLDAPDEAITLYPNPSSNNANITLNLVKESSVTVAVYSVDGALVAKKDYGRLNNGVILPLDFTNYNAGMYFVNITIDGKTTVKKFIKE
jgi:hypothetical protein